MSYNTITYKLPKYDDEEIRETDNKYWDLEAEDKAKGAADHEFYNSGEYGNIFPLDVVVLHEGQWHKFSVEFEAVPQFTAYEDEDCSK